VDEAGQIGGRQMLELLGLARERNARVILSGDTRQHGAVDASDALLAIERHAGVRPIELHKIRRQDPALGRDDDERTRIKQYRKAVESAAAGRLADSFAQLDKMGAVVACGPGDQADKLADEYIRIAEQNASAVVVSQTWAEVHRVNSRIRDALKAKGLLGASDTKVQALERLDLTTAQKRDERFYPPDAVIVFNQKVRQAEPGATGRLGAILKSSVLVEVSGKFVTLSNRFLDRISVCQPRELSIGAGERLHLKANRTLASGHRVSNGELVSVKSVSADGNIKLKDGRVLDSRYREFQAGYAVTSYGAQGKTADFVLFSDSTIKGATNAQQWYVSISRGRRGVRIFTPDKQQLRESITRSGERPLAVDMLRSWKQKSPFFGLLARRFGFNAALIFERSRRAGLRRRLGERAVQTVRQFVHPVQKQSRGIHF
jgi:ATP-dependent exoDNAse (exonuclease V) alpha subunit